jgi:hypothetical protein
MSHTEIRRHEGLARRSAREAVEREIAQRELQEKLRRIEVLRTFTNQQFSRLNRTLISAVLWLFLIAVAFGVIAWYSADVMNWMIGMVG